ncbi:EF-hand domain-containing protein [Sphingomonas adhaesiva]|uniref:EF-hand domain-containing protein n=1 Tax=Sphingomonas adhaesiva TaxID=28212 RepID=UPI002FFA3CD1
MWRYAAGSVATLLLVAAGWLIFNGQARPDPLVPARTAAGAPAQVTEPAPLPEDAGLPEASARTREQKRFDRYDKDRNASITREEYLASRRKAFAKLDVNGDGRLSFDEWAARTTQRFAEADRDRSGTLTAAEFATTAPKRRAARPACRCPQPVTADD